MSLASCPKCWDDLCTCGWKYATWIKAERIKLAAIILGVDVMVLDPVLDQVPLDHPQKAQHVREEAEAVERGKNLLKDLRASS